jgi:hypothetical protein
VRGSSRLDIESMPRGDGTRARLRKKLHDKSEALFEQRRRVAEARKSLTDSQVRRTIERAIELKVLRQQGEALVRDLDELTERVQEDLEKASTDDERQGVVLALEKLAERREHLLKSDGEWAKAIDELGVLLQQLRGG